MNYMGVMPGLIEDIKLFGGATTVASLLTYSALGDFLSS